MNMMKEGKDLESLIEAVEVMDKSTRFRTVVGKHSKVILECMMEDGKLSNWKVSAKKAENLPSPFTKGQRFDSFEDVCEALDQERILFEPEASCTVLCHISTEIKKERGKVVSHWFNIDPYEPYEIGDDGQPKFQMVTLYLSDAEYDAMMNTKLAFMDQEDLYPIQETAIPAIGTLLDCSSAFKRVDDHLLGSALLIAEKLSYKEGIQVIYRKRTRRVYPVMSLISKSYRHIPQKEFFAGALERVSKFGIYRTESWNMSDTETSLSVILNSCKKYQEGFLLKTGDLAGTALTAACFVEVAGVKMILKKNAQKHSDQFDMDQLFEGFKEAFENFEESSNLLKERDITYYNVILASLQKLLGKKRVTKVSLPLKAHHKYNGWYILESILEAYDAVTPPKLKYTMSLTFLNVLNALLKECKKEG